MMKKILELATNVTEEATAIFPSSVNPLNGSGPVHVTPVYIAIK